MPIVPRIRRTRGLGVAAEEVRPARQPAELQHKGLTWIHLDAPDVEQATVLAERFGWHPLDVEDILSKRQRLNAAELDIFLGADYLVTLPNTELLPVTRLFQRCSDDEELRDSLFSKGSGYLLYHVLDDLFDYCFPILDKIGHKLDVFEDELFEGRSEEIVRDISNVKQEIISYRKIIKPE